VRALSVPLKLMDQARAWKHDKNLSNRLTDQAAGLLGHDAVLTIIGPMALTITNHLIRNADTPHTAGLGDGGWTVTWLPGRGLTKGQAAAIETAGAASQIPADCNPQVHGEGFWSRVNAWAGQFGLTGHAGIVQASRGARGRVMAGPRLAMAYSRLVV
jgi:hypothetical protein